jgi:hypothetical protein
MSFFAGMVLDFSPVMAFDTYPSGVEGQSADYLPTDY